MSHLILFQTRTLEFRRGICGALGRPNSNPTNKALYSLKHCQPVTVETSRLRVLVFTKPQSFFTAIAFLESSRYSNSTPCLLFLNRSSNSALKSSMGGSRRSSCTAIRDNKGVRRPLILTQVEMSQEHGWGKTGLSLRRSSLISSSASHSFHTPPASKVGDPDMAEW